MPSEKSIIQETDTILVMVPPPGSWAPPWWSAVLPVRLPPRPRSSCGRPATRAGWKPWPGSHRDEAHVEILSGNLLSRDDCPGPRRGAPPSCSTW